MHTISSGEKSSKKLAKTQNEVRERERSLNNLCCVAVAYILAAFYVKQQPNNLNNFSIENSILSLAS